MTRTLLLASLTAASALLAACEPQQTGPDDPAPQTQANAQAGTPPQAGDRINLAQCDRPSNGRVHFRLGQTVLAVPADAVRDAIPANLTPPIDQAQVKQALQAQAAQGGGCPGKPIDASLLLVETDLGHPLLQGSIGLLATPPDGISGPFTEVTRTLQQEPTENCRDIGGGLIGCVGAETRGDRRTPVMYVIATDPAARLATGGPLAARCVLNEGDNKVRGCSLVDQLPGQIAFDATLAPGTYSAEGLREARARVAATVGALRQN